MMPYTRNLVAWLALSLVPFTAAQATAYKWVDENGETHYSQTPPSNVEVEQIKTPKTPAGAPVTKPQSSDESDSGKTDTPGDTQPVDRKAKAEDAAIRAESCENARKLMETLQSSPRINVQDSQGLYRRLSEEERTTRIEETQKKIDEFCD